MSEGSDEVKRWTARRKAAVVLDIIKGETTAAETARSHDLTVAEVESWMGELPQSGHGGPQSQAQGRGSAASHREEGASGQDQRTDHGEGDLEGRPRAPGKTSARRGLMNKVQNTLLVSGHSIPLTKLCASLGLVRSSAYYQPRQHKARPIDEAMAVRIKRIHR